MITSGISSFLTTAYRVDTDLYDLYSNNDLRKTIYFKNTGGVITFKGNYHFNTSSLFCGLASDEILLIRAECYARKGNKDAAMDDLNALLITRWKNNGSWVPYIVNSADEALSKVLIERRKELILRGLRWSDLRRLNKDDRFKITISRTIGGNTFLLEPNSYKYTFPLPDDVIAQTGMPQTLGW
jgi:starch-binding outer membrane protein, SusD/RagB family